MFSPLREWHATNRFVNCIKGSTKSLKVFLCHSSLGTSLFYCVRPTEKQRLSCLWINCLNPHLLIQSINIFHKSKGLPFQKGESLEEANDDKPGKFYQYQKVVESYIGKEGKPVEYKRTAHIDDKKPVKYLVSLIKDGTKKYKKYRSYVDIGVFFADERCLQWKIHWASFFTKLCHTAEAWGSSLLIFQISSILFTVQLQSHLSSNIFIT